MPRFFRILLFGDVPAAEPLHFGDDPAGDAPRFRFAAPGTEYLAEVRTEFSLDAVVDGAASEYERLRAVSRWTKARWKHGQDAAESSDALEIVREAAGGDRAFRCVEYARVLAAALNAVEVPARVVGLWTRDIEVSGGGASHVVAEAYLRSLGKWVMVDAQFDATPVLDGTPLNAVEAQRALAAAREGVGVDSATPLRADQYLEWLGPYLYHLHAYLDNRYAGPQHPEKLMLLPLGAPLPASFQGIEPVEDMTPTYSTAAFYAPPPE